MMVYSDEIRARREELIATLATDCEYEKTRAVVDYWIAIISMIVALAASFVAGLGGLSGRLGAGTTGMIALIPGAMALVAATLKFEGKSNWHYRKLYALRALADRIKFEMPVEITADQIAQLSKERRDIIVALNKDWEASLGLNWNQFQQR
jgi:hypothetical protein